MQFSVKWAAAAPAYVGMMGGVLAMLWQTHTPMEMVGGLLPGMFLGGAVGLPAAGANLIAAVAVAILLRNRPFPLQFAAFALGSAMLNNWLLHWLDRGLHSIGGLISGPEGLAVYWGFGLASLFLAWLMMRVWPGAPKAV